MTRWQAEFDLLYGAHARAVEALAYRLTGRRDLAEEVVQETFARAWANQGALDGSRGSPRAWLFTVARNVVIDLSRRRAVRPVLVALADGPELSVGDTTESSVEAAMLERAMSRLSADHRGVLLAGLCAGRSVAATAELLDIAPGTVKSRTFYALKAMRLALEELEYER